MRVIAGIAKGRRLKLDRKSAVRPTSDKLREALFSTLGPAIRGQRVLDLYAGTGALGIEALSRGAESATLVDADRSAIAMIRANLAATGLEKNSKVMHQSAERFVIGRPEGPFDLVLMDPPYGSGIPEEVLEGLAAGGFLADGALVVLEVSSRLEARDLPAGFQLRQERRYGDSSLLYLDAEPAG